ncbi:6673_t:CDS:2, partial [Ambispora leptoticha]
TNITTHKGVNYAPLGKILSTLSNLQIDFSTFYHRFDCLFETYSAPTLEWPEPEKRKKKKLGVDAHDVLKEYLDPQNPNYGKLEKYLEALTIYHEQNEKEYEKLPDTSNRKPRIAIRIKHGENFLKAYKKEIKRGGDFKFITKEEFLARVGGERERFSKIVGYEEIINQ